MKKPSMYKSLKNSKNLFLAVCLIIPTTSIAQTKNTMTDNWAEIIWVAVSIALVFFMQAGFALLECGASRAKNAINVIMKNYTDICFGSIFFWAFGYGLMFGESQFGIIGWSHFLPDSLSNEDTIGLVFQLMFAATAATIVSGAVAERMRFTSYLLCAMVISTFIYPIFGHWVWGENGWLGQLGFIDFAGATVVHSVGGWCALAAVIVLGPRMGRFSRSGESRHIPGHNLPMIALGGFILWLGWFGFNGGSATDLNNLGSVLLNTHLGACAGAMGAIVFMTATGKPIMMTTTVNATIGGLVSVTAGADNMATGMAIITGLLSGVLLVWGTTLLERFKIDDVVGAVVVHGFCGAWGTIAAGIFYSGDMFSISRISIQLLGVAAAFIWSFPVAYLTFKMVDKLIGLRASSIHEQRGLDFTEHHEVGYTEFNQAVTHGGITK